MIRLPPCHFNDVQPVRRTCPEFGKSAVQLACAIEVYRVPRYRRILYFCCRYGWIAIVPAVFFAILRET